MKKQVIKNVANLYASGSDSLVSQALLGDTVEVVDEKGEYCVVNTHDRYSGRVRKNDLATVRRDFSMHRTMRVITLFADVYAKPDPRSELITKLVLASEVSVLGNSTKGFATVSLPSGETGYVRRRCLRAPADPSRSLDSTAIAALGINAVAHARKLVGTPYLWGGCSPFGIDCSGLTQLCYRLSGVSLLRDARLQINDKRFDKIDGDWQTAQLLDGDLLFFGETSEAGVKITHVAMALCDGRMIHSAGGMGVVIEERKNHKVSDKFICATRMRSGSNPAIAAA